MTKIIEAKQSWETISSNGVFHRLIPILGLSESLIIEAFIFSTAKQMVGDYDGGLWRVEMLNHEDGEVIRWLFDDSRRYTVSHGPNQVTTTMSAEGMGTVVTLFALYAVAVVTQSDKAYAAYTRLIDASSDLQEWPYILRMID